MDSYEKMAPRNTDGNIPPPPPRAALRQDDDVNLDHSGPDGGTKDEEEEEEINKRKKKSKGVESKKSKSLAPSNEKSRRSTKSAPMGEPAKKNRDEETPSFGSGWKFTIFFFMTLYFLCLITFLFVYMHRLRIGFVGFLTENFAIDE